MNESFEFNDVAAFTTGAVGPKGQRVFYIQCRTDDELVSLRLEKQQVAALAEYLAKVLEDLPALGGLPDPADTTFVDPLIDNWVVASMGVAFDERDQRLLVFFEELIADDDTPAATARMKLRIGQVTAFIEVAREVVAAGRPPCPYCARPLDPDAGGWCACSN